MRAATAIGGVSLERFGVRELRGSHEELGGGEARGWTAPVWLQRTTSGDFAHIESLGIQVPSQVR